MLLKDRIVVVTGASRGIGAATATAMARHGAAVAVNYLQNEEAARAVVGEIEQEGGRAVAVQADVRDPAQVEAMAERITAELGTVDTLVSNASIRFPMVPFMDYPWEAFESKLVGELKAAFNCCKVFVPPMLSAGKGCIIAVSSGLSRHPGRGFCAHSTAKSGLDGLMKSLALELGPSGIRVNVVAPGLTQTDATANTPPERLEGVRRATPLQRVGQPEDVAGAIVMLAADEAGFVSGAYLPASGGSMML